MVAIVTQLYVNMQYYMQIPQTCSLHTVKLNSFNMCNDVSFHGYGMH